MGYEFTVSSVMAASIWDDVLGRVETKVKRFSFDQWFKPTALIADTGASILVRVADAEAVDWLTQALQRRADGVAGGGGSLWH